ncbi:13589_t:CDS:2, partial [Racocetra fulgida]
IEWIHYEQNCIVVSRISPLDASNQYCNIRYLERKTAISGILVFGLQLYEELTKAMPKKNQPICIKPLSDLSNSSHRNKIKKAEKKKKIWHLVDNSKLKELVLEAGEQPWLIKFEEDRQLEEKKAQKIVQIMDEFNISRRGYRALTTTSPDLPKEWLVSKEKNNVNETMQNHIPLLLFVINANSDSDSASDSDSERDSDSESDSNSGSDLDSEVIATTLEKERHYTISLFSGTENYTSLKTALEPIRHELQDLHKN